jgi:hypothetical protein
LKRGGGVEYGIFTNLLVANEKGAVKRLLADSSSGQKASQRKSKTLKKKVKAGMMGRRLHRMLLIGKQKH